MQWQFHGGVGGYFRLVTREAFSQEETNETEPAKGRGGNEAFQAEGTGGAKALGQEGLGALQAVEKRSQVAKGQ